jgi:dihydrofolate reductase
MTRLRAHNISMSLDGYAAGPGQDIDNPLGVGGLALHEWVFATRTGATFVGGEGGTQGVDDDFIARGDEGIGATIMGRNMFGPIRGEWGSEDWTGWWGDDPPYHHPVFVLTHFPRPPIAMAGGTTFHFVDDGIESALEQASQAADGLDVRLGGGVSTIREYLRAGLLDELHVVVVPILLGSGERLFDDVGDIADRYACVDLVSSPSELSVAHIRVSRTP